MKNLFAIAPFVLLAACEAAVPVPALPLPLDTAQDTCGAAQYSNLIGQDATALERVLIMSQVRVIRPGQPISQDFRPQRINFYVGTDNRIMSIRCL